MHKRSINKILGLVLAITALMPNALAFAPSHYATQSKLANGKWVKIKISTSGVHQITAQELSAMGFSNPSAVKIYGSGGNMISEELDGTAPDDLVQVPVARYGDKMCFYAKGPVKFTLHGVQSDTPHFEREINSYSQNGYYFLTEEQGNDLPVAKKKWDGNGTIARPTSLDYFYHEQELASATFSGKDFLGEAIASTGIKIAYELPGLVENTPIYVNPAIAANSTAPAYINASMHHGGAVDEIKFTPLINSKIYAPASTFIHYNSASPVAGITPTVHNENGLVEMNAQAVNGKVNWSKLDYLIITYSHNNSMQHALNGQLRMGFNNVTEADRIEFPGIDANTVIWNIDNDAVPVQCEPNDYTNAEGKIVKSISPKLASKWSQYVAFDPGKSLLKISGYENVSNQNIHGLSTPDMVILTNSTFAQQAERIANMHRNRDGFTVHVIDQEQVFNEFSSGTPDAMAIRLMNKMFYDRDQNKFKYFLTLGCCSFDNRGLTSNKANRVICYESDCSNDESLSFVSDDFFGMLDDNSGRDIAASMLRIGIGRIPSSNLAEAKSDVDKLIKYVESPDYGVWRNNTLILGDNWNEGLHMFQAEGIGNLIENDLSTGMNVDKAYVPMFPMASNASEPGIATDSKTASGAKGRLIEALTRGQFFSSYVGHAGPISFSLKSNMWTMNDAQSTTYEHFPIMTIAACDVACIDGDRQGIGEIMFHKKDGGAIAVLASARTALAGGNDALNKAFINNLFTYKATGKMSRLGDAYMKAKQWFGTRSEPNKMQFSLIGDPAMKANYPKPLFKVTKVNDVAVGEATTIDIYPLQTLNIEAQVNNAEQQTVNTQFNGDATITLFDEKTFFKTVTPLVEGKDTPRDLYHPRNQIAQITGRVENGVFKGSITIPRNVEAEGKTGLLSLYAHMDNSEDMVNGGFAGVNIMPYNATYAVNDTQAPAITSMFFNDETSFAEGTVIAANSTLHIRATDNRSINTQSASVGGTMTLTLDDGAASYTNVKNYAVACDNGKTLNVTFPMTGLSTGRHTLTFSVYDVAGNKATRTISFVVGLASKASLAVEEIPAIEKATFNMESDLATNPEMTIKVTDATGHLVWLKKTSSFPVVWDLKDNNGKKITPGLYKYFGTYENGTEYGGTNINDLIVIDNYKKSN